MGYYIRLTGSDFRIKSENKDKALQALRELMSYEHELGNGGTPSGRHFSWLNNAQPLRWRTLEDALEDWRFSPINDSDGNIIGLQFTGEKLGQENYLFWAISSWVEDGSYIQITGEYGGTWRLVFEDGDVREERVNDKEMGLYNWDYLDGSNELEAMTKP